METKLLKSNNESINLACKLLKKGEVVAIPTETVYGLAADATNKDAIKKIFKAKGRPSDNPLIVHISNLEMLNKIAKNIPEDAIALAKNFWPGPLTIVLEKSDFVCEESCAGLDTVGVRMPAHQTTLAIIEKSGLALSAPSANLSGKPSPTTASDVFDDMNKRIPLIIDGGISDAGVESTVISVLDNQPTILRPGIITKEMIEKVLNKPVFIASGVVAKIENNEKVLSPGMKYKHYSPNAKVIILKGSFEKFQEYIENNKTKNTFALCFDEEDKFLSVPSICYGKKGDSTSQAHNLFSCLRELDNKGASFVFARCPEITGAGLAVYNRLIRSAGFEIIEL